MENNIRCYVICEGQSEEHFIKNVLGPYFYGSNIYLTPLIVPTSKGQKGGALSYDRVIHFVTNKLKEDQTAFVTTLFDYYALDEQFLDNVKFHSDIYVYIENIQRNLDKKIRECCDTDRFFSHIQPHEFESLLFSDIEKIITADANWDAKLIDKLQKIIENFKNPELINNSKETSPSHRLEKIFVSSKYNKVLHGGKIAESIGIEKIRSECQHFNLWCEKLSQLKDRR